MVIVCEFWHLEPLIYSFQGFLCFGVHCVPLCSVWVLVPVVSWVVSFVLISFNWFLFPDCFPSPDCPLCFCVYISSFHLFFVRSLFAHLASFFSLLKNLDPTVCFMFWALIYFVGPFQQTKGWFELMHICLSVLHLSLNCTQFDTFKLWTFSNTRFFFNL